MTIHDILTHMSGLSTGFQVGPVGEIYRAAGLGFGFRGLALEEYCDTLASLPLAFQPGTRWMYSSATDVVGRVVEVASGMSLDAYFDEHIFGPLGMTDTAFWVPEEKQDRFAQCYTRENKQLKPFPGAVPQAAEAAVRRRRPGRHDGRLPPLRERARRAAASSTAPASSDARRSSTWR